MYMCASVRLCVHYSGSCDFGSQFVTITSKSIAFVTRSPSFRQLVSGLLMNISSERDNRPSFLLDWNALSLFYSRTCDFRRFSCGAARSNNTYRVAIRVKRCSVLAFRVVQLEWGWTRTTRRVPRGEEGSHIILGMPVATNKGIF